MSQDIGDTGETVVGPDRAAAGRTCHPHYAQHRVAEVC